MRRRLLAGALGAALATSVGCGLPADDRPQAIARADVPSDLLDPNPGSSTTLPESPATTTVVVFLLEETAGGIRLAEAEREVRRARIPDDRLAALFAVDEPEAGLSTAIPADTVLRDVTTDDEADEVVVDVSGDLLTIRGPTLAQAFAQIVWTATEPTAGGYNFVRFLVDGEPSTVLDGEGVEQEGAVARSDYSNLSPPPATP